MSILKCERVGWFRQSKGGRSDRENREVAGFSSGSIGIALLWETRLWGDSGF